MSQKSIVLGVVGIAVILFIVLSIFRKEPPGAALFLANGCNECHIIKGKGGSVGPSLTGVGKRISREFIVEQIKNPASHNPNTAMPSFKHLPEQDINALADYLASLK